MPDGPVTDISQLPASIPAYLIHVVPELKVDGTVVMSGSSMSLGTELDFIFNPRFVGAGQTPFFYKVPAGSYLAVAVVSGSVGPQHIVAARTRLQATRAILASGDPAGIATLTQERFLGDTFHAGLLGYYTQYHTIGRLLGLRQAAHHQLAAGVGSYGYEPNVDWFFGVPRRLLPGGAAMNIPIVNVAAKDAALSAAAPEYTLQLGAVSSPLEHAIPEHMFTASTTAGEGISAMKALSRASAAGQRIYHITAANQSTTLPMIHHSGEVMSEIRAALAAGREVITHTDQVSVTGWAGAGYVLMDPETGAAAWKISGGGNGSYLTGLFLGMILSVLAVMVIASTAGLALPLLASVLLHATLLELLIAESGGGLDSECFWAGLLAGLSTIGVVLIEFTGARAVIGALLGMLGYSAALLDLDGSRADCGL